MAYADVTNPQSLNLYSYVLNNPLKYVDPNGLLLCDYGSSDYGSSDYGGEDFEDADTAAECTGNGGAVSQADTTVSVSATGNPGFGETSLQGAGVSTFIESFQLNPYAPSNLPKPTLIKATIPGTNYCGPGGNGTPTDQVDAACAAHDLCYQNAGVSFLNNIGLPKLLN